MKECREMVETPASSSDSLLSAMDQVELSCREALKSLGKETDLADLVAMEISAMDVAIEEAAAKIEELLEASRQKDTGAKLEVNEAVLDSCTELVKAIRELVKKSKLLQTEIISDRGAGVTDKEYYKKNSRWTEGLISAAKAVGLGAKLLVDAAGTPPAAASASLQLAIRFLGRGVIFRTPRAAITESNVHNCEFNY